MLVGYSVVQVLKRHESDLFSLRDKTREIKGYELIAFSISGKVIPPDL